jgi:branched-subunit amino acid transport protein
MVKRSKTRIPALFARYMFFEVVAMLLALAAPRQAMAQARKIELDDLRRIVSVSGPPLDSSRVTNYSSLIS